MIKSVTIRNFMCHQRKRLKFTDGINAITGPTDTGKSAIINALCWVIFNKPQGFTFLNNKAKKKDKVKVKINFDNGYIERVRSKTDNYYIVNGEKYTALRGQVPREVLEFLQMDEVNVQKQHEPYFLIAKSSGEIAREINELMNLELIDQLNKELTQRLNKTKSRHKLIEEDKQQIEQQLNDLEWVDKADKEFKRIDSLYQKLSEKKEWLDRLKSVLVRLEQNKEESVTLVVKLDKATAIKTGLVCVSKKQLELKELKGIVNKINNLPKISIPDIEPIEEIEVLISDRKGLSSEIAKLKRAVTSLKKVMTEQAELDQKLESEKQEFDELLKESGVCPLCGRETR